MTQNKMLQGTAIALFILTLLACAVTEQKGAGIDSSASPESAVLQSIQDFLEYYGTADMHMAATVTTAFFRGGRSEEQWVASTSKLLGFLGYQRLESRIMRAVVEGDKAYVHVRAMILTSVVRSEHDEVYRVVKEDGVWKIDGLQIVNEDVRDRFIEL